MRSVESTLQAGGIYGLIEAIGFGIVWMVGMMLGLWVGSRFVGRTFLGLAAGIVLGSLISYQLLKLWFLLTMLILPRRRA